MSDLKRLSEKARELANELFNAEEGMECVSIKHGKSCIMQEEDRDLERKEKQYGWTRRPFWAYRHDNLCKSCEAYWHAELAAQILHEMHCWDVRIKAEKERKKQPS